MRYVKDNIIKSISEARNELPNMSIPDGADLTEFGYSKLIEVPTPIKDGFHYIEALNGVTQTWTEIANEIIIPESVSKVQAMKAMKSYGLWDTFKGVLAQSTDANDEWTLALDLRRDNTFVAMLSPALGITETQIDDLFILAETL